MNPQSDPVVRAESLYQAGHLEEAEALLLHGLDSGIGPAGCKLLARIEYSLGNPHREIEALEALFDHGETDAGLSLRLGSLYARRGDWEHAAVALEEAIRQQPDELQAWQGLVQARFALQDLEAVGQQLDEIHQRFPDAAFTHLTTGHLKKAFGDIEAARQAYRQALELTPTLGEALYGIVDLGPPVDDDMVRLAAELADRNDLPAADRINAGFARARILDSEGDYGEAFRHFEQANTIAVEDLGRQGVAYQPEQVEARVARMIDMYPPESFEQTLAPLPIDLTPIFILGMPRSGTTLFEQILASHPDVAAGGELIFAHQCERRFREARQAEGRSGPVDAANNNDKALLEAARERYMEAVLERDLDAPWVVDKMPANFEIAGFLRLLFPDAPIVHTVRDARATCFSLFTANFSAHEPYYHRREDLAHYYRQYRRLMAHWRSVIPAPFLEMAYEDLARSPDEQIPALLRQVGLSAHPDCLRFYAHERPILTASHAQARRPMYVDAIDRWRHYESWLGPVAEL